MFQDFFIIRCVVVMRIINKLVTFLFFVFNFDAKQQARRSLAKSVLLQLRINKVVKVYKNYKKVFLEKYFIKLTNAWNN